MNNLEKIIIEILNETIRKKNNKYCLVSGSGKNLGCYRSKKGAKKREKQVQFFKHKKMKEDSSSAAVSGYSGPLVDKKRSNNGKN